MNQKIVVGMIVLIAALCIFCCGCVDTTGDTGQSGLQNGGEAGMGNETLPEEIVIRTSGLRLITEEFPPFNYLDENGTVAGQSTRVVEEILQRLNQTGTIEVLPWEETYKLALTTPDVAIFSTTRTTEREDLFQWVGPVASYDIVLYANNGSDLQITNMDELKKAGSIGALQDSARYQYLAENNVLNLTGYENDIECVQNLMDGEIVLWLGSSATVADIARNAGYAPCDLEAVYSVGTYDLYIAFSKNTPEDVVTVWQDELDAMKLDGTFGGLTTPSP